MTLTEILQGLADGAFEKGTILESDEGFWFKISDTGHLLGKASGEIFEIGKLATPPAPGLDNPEFGK